MEDTQQQQTGFSYEMREDGILIYRLANLHRDTVDAFVEFSHEHDIQAYEAGMHSRCLLDVSNLSFPTPYAIKRIRESISTSPDGLRESYAVVTPTKPIYTFARGIMSNLPSSKTSSIHLFSSQEDALLWLTDRLQELGD